MRALRAVLTFVDFSPVLVLVVALVVRVPPPPCASLPRTTLPLEDKTHTSMPSAPPPPPPKPCTARPAAAIRLASRCARSTSATASSCRRSACGTTTTSTTRSVGQLVGSWTDIPVVGGKGVSVGLQCVA